MRGQGLRNSPRQGNPLCCLWRRGQRGNSAACLLVSDALFNELSCEAGSISHYGNPNHSPQSVLSLSFPLTSASPTQPVTGQPASLTRLPCCHGFSELACVVCHLTGLVVLVDFSFNSLVVRVPCSLIVWHFWLFIDFILVVILLLVV